MSQVINTNVASLNAQRNLQSSQSSLATSLQRLSSGLRINSAKDDAAGLAISERFTTQIRGINQAIRNANDGISLAQVGESALAEVTTNLQRIRELAVQSANATNSDSDRLALDLEVQQRLQEIDRVASQTAFNGRKLLDGSFGNATFQIGAEAGQSLTLNLGDAASTRLSAIGKVAQATSAGAIGGPASTGGTLAVSVSSFDFGTQAQSATSGRSILTLAGTPVTDFTASAAGTRGTFEFAPTVLNYSSGRFEGAAFDSTTVSLNFTGPANLAQLNVDGRVVELNQNYADWDAVATDLQAQIRAGGAQYENYIVEFDDTTPAAATLTITNVGSGTAVAISSADTRAGAIGLADGAGTAGGPNSFAEFVIDGKTIRLDGNYGSAGDLATALQTALDAEFGPPVLNTSGYTVSEAGGTITIRSETLGSTAPTIGSGNAAAVAGGLTTGTSTDGDPVIGTDVAGFDIDGIGITLNDNYGSVQGVVDEIQSQLNAATSPAVSYNVSIDSLTNSLVISRTSVGAGSSAVVVNNTSGDFGTAFTGVNSQAGTDAVVSTAASFQVDGINVSLNSDFTNGGLNTTQQSGDALAAAIQSTLGGNYSANFDAGTGELTITNGNAGSAAVTISNADPNAFAAGLGNASGTAGTVEGAFSLGNGDFSINGVALTGNFNSVSELATQINTSVSGVFATVDADTNQLTLSSASAITLGGSQATTTMGFASNTIAADSGSLAGGNVTSVEAANAMIQRIDSALTSVSNFRSTFGAIQNRFESVTANLTSSVENLSASRSRILDADFAAETANLTRAQILQQAGVAMLAQANALPQNVLSLLR